MLVKVHFLLLTFAFFLLTVTRQPAWAQSPTIDPLSVISLEVRILHDDLPIGTATGFVVEKNGKHYFLTNRHVVLACGQDPRPTNVGAWICANKISIFHNSLRGLGQWLWVTEELCEPNREKITDEHCEANHTPRWIEHPGLKGAADLVALPLAHSEGVQFYPLDIIKMSQPNIALGPGDTITIVGFPLGLAQAAGLAIWKTGTIASDLDINYGGKPTFIVDTTSRSGMSGSPVYAVRNGSYSAGNNRVATVIGNARKFLGVYAEQSEAAEIGRVWKADVVVALYDSLP